jgi:hypothetical protein
VKANIPQRAIDEAKEIPNGWVYELDGDFEKTEAVPPDAIKGAWPVGPNGVISGPFVVNPNYRPSHWRRKRV